MQFLVCPIDLTLDLNGEEKFEFSTGNAVGCVSGQEAHRCLLMSSLELQEEIFLVSFGFGFGFWFLLSISEFNVGFSLLYLSTVV